MEWHFCINWPSLVEEAKQRRKTQKLTQERLAELAGVSTPTVSRFESGKTDILLSTTLSILGVLGMIDKRVLTFPDQKAYYDSIRGIVIFKGQDRNTPVSCAISEEALEDHFGTENKKTPLSIFTTNRKSIEHLARRKYLWGQKEPDGSTLIRSEDI